MPNLAIKLTAILELKPDRIIGLARIIALKTKNTVLLANDLYVFTEETAPDNGSKNKATIPGTASGSIFDNHKNAQAQNTAKALWACVLNPGNFIKSTAKKIIAVIMYIKTALK